MSGNKLTAKQRADRIKAAQDREEREKKRREAQERNKKIFTIIICAILVLALSIPTVAFSLLG